MKGKLPEARVEISKSLQEVANAKTKEKLNKTSRSKTRQQSRSPSRRNVSPGRSGRSKSPARPARRATSKSPSRTAKKTPKTRSDPDFTPTIEPNSKFVATLTARTPIGETGLRSSPRLVKTTRSYDESTYYSERIIKRKPYGLDTDSDEFDDYPRLRSKISSDRASKESSRKIDDDILELKKKSSEVDTVDFTTILPSRSRRSPSKESVESMGRRRYTPKLLGEISDEDEFIRDRISNRYSVETDKRSDGVFSILGLLFGFPVYVWALHAFCNEHQCSFTELPHFRTYTLLSTYVHLQSFGYFAAFCGILALLSILPFGGKKVSGLPTRQGRLDYNANGLFASVMMMTGLTVLELRGYPIFDFIIEHTFHLLVAAFVESFLVAIYLYIRSFYVNLTDLTTHTLNSNWLYSFFVGRELNPRFFWGLLDLKFYILRLSILGAFLYDFAYVWKNIISPNYDFTAVNWTLIVFCTLHTIYFVDGLIFESSWVTTYEVLYEGVGYMSVVGYPLFPFISVTATRYISDYNVQKDYWVLIVASLIFVGAFLLLRLSNREKDAFRKNPYQARFKDKETIPTAQGKKLLASGYWGWVRHPNYLGDILVQIAYLIFLYDVPPQLQFVFTIAFLLHRAGRDNERCKSRYGTAWDRYCAKVKYALIPGIY